MALTTVDQGLLGQYAQYTGFKNRIINGAMMIDQRNAGASVNQSGTSAFYTVDRWIAYGNVASKFSVQQNAGAVTPPAGFVNYLGVTSSSSYTSGSGDVFILGQKVEGLNIADLGWGTVNAATVTLSFKVYSSLTGTFSGAIYNNAGNRSYPFAYTVSSANTWTTVSVAIPGDTSGTWLTTNGAGLQVFFDLGSGSSNRGAAGSWAGAYYTGATGSVSVVGTNGATFYITGVQLEKGSTATSFDYRPYGTELALCQRYYEKSYDPSVVAGTATYAGVVQGGTGSNNAGSTTYAFECFFTPFVVQKRSAPTMAGYDPGAGTSGQWQRFYTGVSPAGAANVTFDTISYKGFRATVSAGSAANCVLGQWTASAEL